MLLGFFLNYFLITWFHCTHFFLSRYIFTLFLCCCWKQPIQDHLVIQSLRLRHQNKILFAPSNKVCAYTFQVHKCHLLLWERLIPFITDKSHNPTFIFKMDKYNMAFESLASSTYTFSQNTFCGSFLINIVSL